MAVPTLTLQIAFSTGPFSASPSWTDVTSYWREGTFQTPSRSFELDLIEAGGGGISLDNADRRFEPDYTSGAYYPNVLPVRRARLVADTGTTFYPWAGYVEAFEPDWTAPQSTDIAVRLIDAMEALAAMDVVASYAQESTGTRIGNILDSIGFPAADRDLDTGQSTIAARVTVATDETKALDLIRETLATEGPGSAFFIDGRGYAVFHDRHKRLKAPYTTSVATFNDNASGAEIPYETIDPNSGKDLIVNDARVTRNGGTTQTATDTTSIAAYMRRSRAVSTFHISDVEPADYAYYLVSRYKDPALRFDTLEVAPLESSAIWAAMLALDLGDRVTVKRTPPQHPAGSGGTVEKDCHVEGITWIFPDGELRDARVRLQLSSADQTSYWVLGDSVNGLLGVSTQLAY